MNQVAKGLTKRDRELRKYILKDLTSAKWYLWHGNVFKALELIENLLDNTSVLTEDEKKPCLEAKKWYCFNISIKINDKLSKFENL
jgi:hypothetical protein